MSHSPHCPVESAPLTHRIRGGKLTYPRQNQDAGTHGREKGCQQGKGGMKEISCTHLQKNAPTIPLVKEAKAQLEPKAV